MWHDHSQSEYIWCLVFNQSDSTVGGATQCNAAELENNWSTNRPRCIIALLLVSTPCYYTPTIDSFVSIFISPENFLERRLVQSWTLTAVQYNSNQPLSDIQRLCHEWGSAPTKPSSDGCVFPEHSCYKYPAVFRETGLVDTLLLCRW